ncbi:AlkA N-terminal domain-containing protein [Anaeromyxobacter dehalogenans]|uniref:DNA-3-methyladenine glycosylase II n=1 Tax=Anaeromyxobacter dehalogenans (strain 2CP-C) TaxID=290397 RepID=Q2IPL2_ANADE|nr:AlkA N-terminal domain-containing protein [Anaeromyxobacter dehalogenans]ABC80745.1 DNA-3-methyladenine glycosylase II / DNA-O6-methylguanine--protein-cysteine S-methyltransferase [Anaeromyxobacter dehalogenans 2CP-C]
MMPRMPRPAPPPPPVPGLDAAACWRAHLARDARFDGRFFTAVLSTGIFCRPICPARTPRREHCAFYPSAAAAQAAGFRPCLRCRPELAPGVAGWRGTANTVARALALISAGAWGEGDDVEALAERVGVGGRQLRRLFARHVGAPPIRIAQAQRVLLAWRLLADTALPLGDVAAAAGFGSVRRFNEAVRRTFRRPPGALRRGAAVPPPDGAIAIALPHTAPYDWPALLEFLAARAIPGVEQVADGAYRRTVALDGAAGTVEVRPDPRGRGLLATLRLPRVAAIAPAVERLRRLLDLDADAAAIGAHLSGDPLLAPLLAARPGLRVPGAWEPFELVVRAVLGQQVSVAAARTLAGRLAARLGAPVDSGDPALSRLFPGPEALAGADLEGLGLTRARAATLAAIGGAVRDDPSLLAPGGELEDAVARLDALPGIGRWTAQYVAMRALHQPDAFPEGDLGLLAALGGLRGRGRAAPGELLRRAERWRPWRAYAALHLWMSLRPRAPAAARARRKERRS